MRKTFVRPLSDSALRTFAETFHLGFAVAPIIASIGVTLFTYLRGSPTFDKKLYLAIEFVCIATVIFVNFTILWARSRSDESRELSLFRSFFTNSLRPNQSGKEQRYHVNIAVIEDVRNSYFRQNLKDKYKKQFSLHMLKSLISNVPKLRALFPDDAKLETVLEEVKDHELYFKPVLVGGGKGSDPESIAGEIGTQLRHDLEHATSVVVVRTSELDERRGVYEAINRWAFDHSEIPVLVAKNAALDLPKGTAIDNFLHMPDDSKSLPWRFIQRAMDRAKAWRIQAAYNRAMVWNIIYLGLMFVYFGLIVLSAQEMSLASKLKGRDEEVGNRHKEYAIATRGMESAIETEREYRKFTSIKDDSTLNVSYWYRYDGKPYVFVTTELQPDVFYFENGYDKVISCGFADANRVIQWPAGRTGDVRDSKAVAYDNYDHIVDGQKCEMKFLPTNPIKAIVCATFDWPSGNGDTTSIAGVCVFTSNSENNLFLADKQSRDYLRSRAQKFYADFTHSPMYAPFMTTLALRTLERTNH